MLAFYAPILATLVFDAVLLGLLAAAYHSKRFEARRISMKPSMRIPARERLSNIAVSSLLSLLLVIGLTYLLYQTTLHQQTTSAGRMLFDVGAILLVYDFAYYWLHRAMHHKALMKHVHAIHHRVHNPTAMESFYLHPAELVAGLMLLVGCTWLVGPVHIYAFAAVFLVHSMLNITVHSGLVSGRWWLRPIDHLTEKHYIHHAGDIDKNYASLTPLPDMLFRTRG